MLNTLDREQNDIIWPKEIYAKDNKSYYPLPYNHSNDTDAVIVTNFTTLREFV